MQEVAVIGVADEYWGEVVAAVIVCHDKQDTILEELKEICSKHLGRYKIPKKIMFIDELPKTSVGKIDKKALQIYAKAAK